MLQLIWVKEQNKLGFLENSKFVPLWRWCLEIFYHTMYNFYAINSSENYVCSYASLDHYNQVKCMCIQEVQFDINDRVRYSFVLRVASTRTQSGLVPYFFSLLSANCHEFLRIILEWFPVYISQFLFMYFFLF